MQNEDLRRQQAMMQSDAGLPITSGAFAHLAPKGVALAIAPRQATRALPKAA